MAYKMKGHELPGPNQRKGSPAKWVGLVISGLSALASASAASKEKKEARLKQKTLEMKDKLPGDLSHVWDRPTT
tara:strand:+ start:901 stop:1122 length:222 start_codon:yes stop_codon:yes gene_type:complete